MPINKKKLFKSRKKYLTYFKKALKRKDPVELCLKPIVVSKKEYSEIIRKQRICGI